MPGVCGDPTNATIAGQCVQCNVDGDCTDPASPKCTKNLCVPANCTDGIKDGTETAVDCGGNCPPCGNGMACKVAGDCTSGVCTSMACAPCAADTQCGPASYCDTGNNGGTCTPQKTKGAPCAANDQCKTGFCTDNVCCDQACGGDCESCLQAHTGNPDGTCGNDALGTTCTSGGGHVCNGNGTCVGCNTTADCGTGQVCCGNACADLTSDPANCGACGHGCLGGACSGSQCQPVLLNSANPVDGLAVDATNVYWSTNGVDQCAINNCATTQTQLANNGAVFGIAVDATSVYWVSFNGAMKCAIGGCGGNPTVLGGTGVGLFGYVAVDTTNVYWPDGNGNINKCAVGGCGGTPTVLASSQGNVRAIAVDATSVYWTISNNPGSVMKCAIGGCGGTPTTLASGLNTPGTLVVDATSAYWSNGDGTVMKCSTNSCVPTTLASGQGAYGITVDATNIYWTNGGGVMRCAIGGCGGNPALAVYTPNGPQYIAQDAISVYFNDTSGIKRFAK
jgi:hypothetical protein